MIGGTTDSGVETAASTIGNVTRRLSAPMTALSTVRARAPGSGCRTRARTGAAPGDAHAAGTGFPDDAHRRHGLCPAMTMAAAMTQRDVRARRREARGLRWRAAASRCQRCRSENGEPSSRSDALRDGGDARAAMARKRRARCATAAGGGRAVAAATADGAGAKRGDADVRARTWVGGARSDGWAYGPTLMTPVVKHEESGRCREAPAASSRRALLTRL